MMTRDLRGRPASDGVRRILWTLLLCSLPIGFPKTLASWENDYLIRAWETEHGLPQNSVISIAQTRDGYLWFGTFNGLARFDGFRFTVFDRSNSQLSSGAIRALNSDAEGRLWILTVEQDLFLLAGGTISRVPFDSEAKPLFFGSKTVIESSLGLLTLTTLGIARFDGTKFVDISARFGVPLKGRANVITVSAGRTWLASGDNVGLLTEGHFEPRFNLRTLNGISAQILAPGSDGSLWIQYDTASSVFTTRLVLDSATGQLHPSGRTLEGGLWCLLEDREKTLWAGSNGFGLATQNPDGSYRNLTTDHGLSHNQIRSIFEDREGNLWLGTDGGGVMRVKQRTIHTFDKSSGFFDEIISSVSPIGDSLSVGTYGGGLYRLTPQAPPAQLQPFPKSPVRSILRDRAGSLWVGTFGDGLFRQSNSTWIQFRLPAPQEKQSVLSILQDRSGKLWVGGPFGLGVHHDTQVEPCPLDGSSPERTPVICALAEDHDGTLWAASREDGLFSIRHGTVRRYTTHDGLPSNRLLCLLSQKEGPLWIGTEDHGLSRLAGDHFLNFGLRDGLPRTICSLLNDLQGSLWLGTYNGIIRVTFNELNACSEGRVSFIRTAAYGLEDGLKTHECTVGSQPSACRTEDGKLWFATIKGLAMVDPLRETGRSNPPPVQIEEISIDQQVVYSNVPSAQTNSPRLDKINVIVPAASRTLNVRYTGLAFSSPEQLQFKHQMTGFDRDWVVAGSARNVTYPKLLPGNYEFAVTAALRDGPWNPLPGMIHFRVLPFWWQTVWFRGLASVAAIASALGLIRWQTQRKCRHLLEMVVRQETISDERARISRDMHDGLGSKLTQVSLLARSLEQPTFEHSQARETARRISSLSHDILQSMSDTLWAVDPKHDNLESLAEQLISFAQEHLALARIRCRIEFPASFPPVGLPPAHRHHVLMIFKEAVQNAVKHSSASQVVIRMTLHESQVNLHIEDNGMGLPTDCDPKHGRGLANMQERINALHGHFEIQSHPGRGTSLRLSFTLSETLPSFR